MTIREVIEVLNADILSPAIDQDKTIETICGSDMMSDVLAYIKKDALLLTGLTNPQVIRTAEMLDIVCLVFVRGKSPTEEMIQIAEDCGVYVLRTDYRMYEACGKLYQKRGY